MNMLDYMMLESFFSGIEIPSNASVLDVGCQSVHALKWIKERYNLTGRLIGVDKMSKNFEDAIIQKDLGISLLQMDVAEKLDFPDETFDMIFNCNTLECFSDIPSHITEMHRVLKPNGKIICVHQDWENIVFNGKNKELINKSIYGYANYLQAGWMDACDGWIGRRLWGYFNRTKLFDGSINIYNKIETEFIEGNDGYKYINEMDYFIEPEGFLTQSEYEELLFNMQETYNNGEYLCNFPYYVYRGVKK